MATSDNKLQPHDNSLSAELLANQSLDRLRSGSKLAAAYWRFGKELWLCQDSQLADEFAHGSLYWSDASDESDIGQ